MRENFKLPITALTFILVWVLPIFGLKELGVFDSLEVSENSHAISIFISYTGFLFSLVITYIVGNLCDGISVFSSYSNFRNGTKFIFKVIWCVLLLVLAGWVVLFFYSNMPFWAFVIAILLLLICLRLGKLNA
jgi:hypothetical protein